MPTVDLVAIFVAVVAGSLVKSVTGMGLPLVAIPIMSLFVPTETAIVVLSIPNVAQNVVIAVRHRGEVRAVPGLALFCVAGVAGAVVGALSLGAVPDRVTQLVLITIVTMFLLTRVAVPDWTLRPRDVRRFNLPVGVLSGLLQGAIGISGPIVGSWYSARRLPRESFIFAITSVFLLTGSTQIVVFARQGMYAGRWSVMALLIVVVTSTIPLGAAIRDRVSVIAFERAVLVLLAASVASITLKLVA